MALNGEARQLVARVQALRDERDELLDMLSAIVDGEQVQYDGCTTVAHVPSAVMDEIRRRVIGGDS